jgi:hypothetical protein
MVTPPRCSNWNPFEKTEKRQNAANSNVFVCSAKLPKLRTWVRLPSPAPYRPCRSDVLGLEEKETMTTGFGIQAGRHFAGKIGLDGSELQF